MSQFYPPTAHGRNVLVVVDRRGGCRHDGSDDRACPAADSGNRTHPGSHRHRRFGRAPPQ